MQERVPNSRSESRKTVKSKQVGIVESNKEDVLKVTSIALLLKFIKFIRVDPQQKRCGSQLLLLYLLVLQINCLLHTPLDLVVHVALDPHQVLTQSTVYYEGTSAMVEHHVPCALKIPVGCTHEPMGGRARGGPGGHEARLHPAVEVVVQEKRLDVEWRHPQMQSEVFYFRPLAGVMITECKRSVLLVDLAVDPGIAAPAGHLYNSLLRYLLSGNVTTAGGTMHSGKKV